MEMSAVVIAATKVQKRRIDKRVETKSNEINNEGTEPIG
jgi:hypothetical protein